MHVHSYLVRSIDRAESSQLTKERDIAAYKAKLGVRPPRRARAHRRPLATGAAVFRPLCLPL